MMVQACLYHHNLIKTQLKGDKILLVIDAQICDITTEMTLATGPPNRLSLSLSLFVCPHLISFKFVQV